MATDPGLLRLRLALRAVVAVALGALAAQRLGPAVGIPSVVAMLFAGVVGMVASFATSARAPRDAALTLAPVPLVAAGGSLLAAVLHAVPLLQDAGYVVVVVAAVWVRRIGQRSFANGMLFFQSYLFVAFSGLTLRLLPAVVLVQLVAAAAGVLAASVLVPDRPAATLAAARRAFTARVHALAATAADVVVDTGRGASGSRDAERAVARLHARSLRLVEAALIIDGYLATTPLRRRPPPAPGPPPATERARLLHAELASAALASAVARLPACAELAPAERDALAGALDALAADDLLFARARVRRLVEAAAAGPAGGDARREAGARVREVAAAVEALLDVLTAPTASTAAPAGAWLPLHVAPSELEPAVALLQGNLPGSFPSAAGAAAAGARWSGWSLNTRWCVQAAVASTASLLLGHLLSATRWYWALLACFLVLTGTPTTGESATKGVNRLLGTVVGLFAAALAVHTTGGRAGGVVAVMIVCGGLGLYFFRVNYAVMSFAVTTVMGMLYQVLHEFSDALLGLRLAETAIGAVTAVVVTLVVLPVRSRDAVRAARTSFLAALDALLVDVRDRLARPQPASDLYLDARRLDAQLLQLALVSRPAGGPALTGLSSRTAARAVQAWTDVAYQARTLAVAVARTRPGSRPDVAAAVEAVLGAGGRVPVDGGGPPALDLELDLALDGQLAQRVDQLREALSLVRPAGGAGLAAVAAGARAPSASP